MPAEYMLPGGDNPYVYVPIQPALKQCSISQAFWIKHFQCNNVYQMDTVLTVMVNILKRIVFSMTMNLK